MRSLRTVSLFSAAGEEKKVDGRNALVADYHESDRLSNP